MKQELLKMLYMAVSHLSAFMLGAYATSGVVFNTPVDESRWVPVLVLFLVSTTMIFKANEK